MVNTKESFIFETFDEAMNVHKKLHKMIRQNGSVSYADLIYLLGGPNDMTDPIPYRSIGWTSLWRSKIEPYDNNGRWVLRMPKLKNIKKEK